MIVKLTGMRALDHALSQLPKAVARRTALTALRKGGEPMAKVMRQLAPVEEGHLREGIIVSATLAASQRADRGAIAPVEMHVGPGQHPQAITQEFGTWFHRAQPFVRPAWDLMKMRTLDLIGAHLGLEIEKAAAREGRKAARGR